MYALSSSSAITSEVLVTHGINAPTTQSFFNYCLLAIFAGSLHCYKSGGKPKLQNPWYKYLGLAALDVEGNYLVTKAYQVCPSCCNDCYGVHAWHLRAPHRVLAAWSLCSCSCCCMFIRVSGYQDLSDDLQVDQIPLTSQYTSITSVTLLDSTTLPAVMLLSWLVFRCGHEHSCEGLKFSQKAAVCVAVYISVCGMLFSYPRMVPAGRDTQAATSWARFSVLSALYC